MSTPTTFFLSCLYLTADASPAGSYGHFKKFTDDTAKTSKDIQTDIQWLRLPDLSIKHNNAVFMSTQYFTESGPAGYLGTQVWRDKNGDRTMHAIFSMWDANETVLTAWDTPTCSRFGGEGTGAHCIIDVDLTETKETPKTLKFHEYSTNATHSVWQGLYGEREIGRLALPNYKGHVGYGHLQITTATFVEYFLGGNCTKGETVNVQIGTAGPYFENRQNQPTVATSILRGPCSDVSGGIQGDVSKQGAPYLTYSNGPDYHSMHPKGADLWASSEKYEME